VGFTGSLYWLPYSAGVTVLAWQRADPGTPPVATAVLLHAWASDGSKDWGDTGLVAGLEARGVAVLVPDLPGHGGSVDVLLPPGAEPGAWTAGVIESDLARLHPGPIGVVGYAEGCLVATHLAVRGTERVNRLALLSRDDRSEPFGDAEIVAALRNPDAPLWSAHGVDALARARAAHGHDLPTLANWIERGTWPAAPRLGALRTPVTVVVGTDDEHRERAPRLAQLFHDGRLTTVPGDERTMLAAGELADLLAGFLTPTS
jgi:pimeloyl-ACP methyl ester carboxylesterase